MDLRNLCSKFDVDTIRAKIPPLPQIKLPKSMTKLKSRKIFRSSREDVNSTSRRSSSKQIPTVKPDNLTLPLGPPPSEFINRTPTRISTISSLMRKRGGETASKWASHREDEENSYRNAGGIDDFYPSPLSQRFEQRYSRPISPVKAPPIAREFQAQSEQNIKMSFTEKLQKGYKDVTEFKFKHIFAKRTVVHKDNIEIIEYVHRYDEERRREQRIQDNIDRDIADNYRFRFKVSKQDSEESYGNSPIDSPQNPETHKAPKNLSELSGDESGMESSPPPRKPGIASTRFAGVRKIPLSMSLEEDNENTDKDDIDNIELDEQEISDTPKRQPNKSTLYSIKKRRSPSKSIDRMQSPLKSKSFRERMGRLTKHKSEGDVSRAASEKKRKAPLSPHQSLDETKENEELAQEKSEKTLNAIKQNFKRFQKSIKLPQSMQATGETENEETNSENKSKTSKAQQFTERLKRFRSTDHVDKNPDEEGNNESPMHKISNKLQAWKKSFKKKPDTHQTDIDEDDEATSPQKRDKPVGSLMKKLKHIRSRRHESTDDPDEDEEGGDTYKESLAARAKFQIEKGMVAASLVPQRTMKKISETKKYLKKKPDSDNKSKSDKSKSDDEDEEVQPTTSKPPTKTMPRPPPPIPRPFYHYSSDDEGTETREEFIKKSIIEAKQITVPAARTAWTTKPILSDDTTDYDDELPRVLIHQDNSDIFESTLIIAVTRPRSHATTPIITELPPDSAEESTPDTKPDNWIPNKDMVATYMDMSPPLQRKLSKDSIGTSSFKGHLRKQSIDSSSEDSWIKDIPRGPSVAILNSVNENDEPWKIQKGEKNEKIYKTKSIDLFEMQKKHGGALTAFEDFDDELKNTPVVRIEEQEPTEHVSSKDPDKTLNDHPSEVAKISTQAIKNNVDIKESNESKLKSTSYGNSQESLTGNLDYKEAVDSGEEDDNEESEQDEVDKYDKNDENDDDELDRPPSKTPSPPPSISPPPPPLPERQPSIRLSKISTLSQSSEETACPSEPPPPLPLTKPPISLNRPAPPAPPKIPERNVISTRISKPLVKTASLRLAYDEQVNPEDVGKVNKLISRFEPDGPKQRPRIIPRKPLRNNDSEDYSEEEDSIDIPTTRTVLERFRDTTPTNHHVMQKSFSIDSADIPNNNLQTTPIPETTSLIPPKVSSQIILDNRGSNMSIPSISISNSCQDVNSNFSQPSSVYGSPLPYPSSLISSAEVTPLTIRKDSEQLQTRRNRRSLVRDDENFYSFDSDEENSYYSIGSNSSNRYVVEL